MGLETAHPAALERLNKGFTLEQFARAARRLRARGASLRVFLLVGVPFVPRQEQEVWIARSVSFAFECGASAVSLIPTRSGNGALEALQAAGEFQPPALGDLEAAFARGLANGSGRVFADLWDLRAFSACASCFDARYERLRCMNLEQRLLAPVRCTACTETLEGRL